MKLIDPSVELLSQAPGLEGVYKQIELVGRICYKSENKITETSAKPFVDRMIASKHYAMLEHGTVYLKFKDFANNNVARYIENPYSMIEGDPCYVTTNYRVLVENDWLDDLQYLCKPTEFHEQRICLKFNTDISVSREGNRHRKFSIAEQSTRYCNFSKDKFGNELTFVKPVWLEESAEGFSSFMSALLNSEKAYFELLNKGWQPQQAREVLPLATATSVVYTAFKHDWQHFIDLRYKGTTGAPHPNMKQVATMAYNLINSVE